MNDFDFDELDRAVSSVLAKGKDDTADTAQAVATPAPSDQAQSVPVSTAAPAAVSDPETTTDTEASEANTVPVQAIPANDPTPSTDTADTAEHEAPSVELTPLALDEVPTPAATQLETIDEETTQDEVKPPEVESANEVETVSSLASETNDAVVTDEPSDTATPRVQPTIRRGKFMDVVSPTPMTSNGDSSAGRPTPTHTTVTLQPSESFSAVHPQETPADTVVETTAEVSAENDEQAPAVNVDFPESADEETTVSEPDTQLSTPQVPPEAPDQPTMETEAVAVTKEEAATPFIPDVSVDKRPLNPPTETPEADVPQEVPVDEPAPVVGVNVPKEFNKEIMAVEANETVGAPADETAVQPAAAPAKAEDTNLEHPLFDTSSIAPKAGEAVVAHPASKMTWMVIGITLFLVGAILGVLYFLYGQS